MANPAPWLLVSAGFHDRGGQSRANAAVVDYLAKQHIRVTLVAHEVDTRFLDNPYVTVHRVARPAGADFFGNFNLWHGGRAAARRLCRRHPDARVLVNGGNCCWPGINWVHYVHAGWSRPVHDAPPWFRAKDWLASRLARRGERQALQAAQLILTNSDQTRNELLALYRLDPDRVQTLYLGCDPDWRPASPSERRAARAWLAQPDERPLAVFVGGLGHDERKGFDTLWKAWLRLCRQPDWDVDLVVAGDGSRLKYWQQQIARANLGSRLRILGFTDRVFDLLAAADVLVSPVRYEPYGLNVQEAICRGVPAIITAMAGAREQYSPELQAMVMSDPESADQLVERFFIWRADIAGWRERFLPLSEKLRSYSWQDMAERLVARSGAIVEASAGRGNRHASI